MYFASASWSCAGTHFEHCFCSKQLATIPKFDIRAAAAKAYFASKHTFSKLQLRERTSFVTFVLASSQRDQ